MQWTTNRTDGKTTSRHWRTSSTNCPGLCGALTSHYKERRELSHLFFLLDRASPEQCNFMEQLSFSRGLPLPQGWVESGREWPSVQAEIPADWYYAPNIKFFQPHFRIEDHERHHSTKTGWSSTAWNYQRELDGGTPSTVQNVLLLLLTVRYRR